MILKGRTHADIMSIKEVHAKNTELKELETYLSSTDWYAVRFAETGKAIPEDVILARQSARDKISELKAT